MTMRNRTYRLIVVTGLVGGVAAIGVAPLYHAAGVGCPVAVQTNGGTHACCCGVRGRCKCGAACCQAPAPKQDPVPAPPKSSDESTLVLGLVHAADLATASPPAATRWQFSLRDGPHWSADSSLLALSVRLNL